jgi:hypothetical protein
MSRTILVYTTSIQIVYVIPLRIYYFHKRPGGMAMYDFPVAQFSLVDCNMPYPHHGLPVFEGIFGSEI